MSTMHIIVSNNTQVCLFLLVFEDGHSNDLFDAVIFSFLLPAALQVPGGDA